MIIAAVLVVILIIVSAVSCSDSSDSPDIGRPLAQDPADETLGSIRLSLTPRCDSYKSFRESTGNQSDPDTTFYDVHADPGWQFVSIEGSVENLSKNDSKIGTDLVTYVMVKGDFKPYFADVEKSSNRHAGIRDGIIPGGKYASINIFKYQVPEGSDIDYFYFENKPTGDRGFYRFDPEHCESHDS